MSLPAQVHVLALDQGGQSSRALVFDRHGQSLAMSSHRIAEVRAGEDRVEQDPEELVSSLRASIAEASAHAGDVVCAGLATQRSSLVCWDRTSGAALSPVLSWQDRRAAAWLASFDGYAVDVRERTGLFLSPHYGASKMRWCLDHLPAVQRALDAGVLAIGPLASFLAFRLLRERPFVVDPANASRTLLWNVRTRDWDPVLLARFGIPREVLPQCVPTRHAFGMLAVDEASVPFEILNGDQSAAAFANGAPRADTVYVNLGTGAFVQRPVDGALPDLPRLLASVVYADASRATHVVEGTVNGAGSALHMVGDELGVGDIENVLDTWMDEVDAPPLFLNGVSGLAAPFWIADFRSRFVGEGSACAKIVAVAESIAFLVTAIHDEMATKIPLPARIVLSGGLSRSTGLAARIAALARAPVERAQESEATARGLAWLLARDREPWDTLAATSVEPFEHAAKLRERYERWTEAMRNG